VVIDLKPTGKEHYTHVKTLFALVLVLGLLAGSGLAQPTITQIQNSASNAVNPVAGTATGSCLCSALPNSAIAQGSFFSIYGTGIGPSAFQFWNPYPLPTSLGGVTINIAVPAGATPVAAYPEFVSSGQINAVLASTTPVGTGTVTVTYNGATSAAFPITVVAMSFGTFSQNEAGTGPGSMTNAVSNVLVTPFSTIAPGDYVTIWGTGLGPAPNLSTEGSAPPPQTNLCTSQASCPVTVWVGGVQATVTYAGRSGYTAEDQIDFIVPNSAVVQGCYVQVAVQTGSIIGNFTSLAVDPTGPTCQDDDGINYGDLASVVTSKGQANVGSISLLSNYLNLSIAALDATLQWDNDTVSGEIGTLSQGVLSESQGFTLVPSVNNCTVDPFLRYPPPLDPSLGAVTYLDAGAQLSIQGPTGTIAVPKTNGKGYGPTLVGGSTIEQLITETTPPAPFFLTSSNAITPTTFTVTGPGGANVGVFSAPIAVTSAAAAFKWTNQATVTASAIPRNAPLTITWTGGDPNGFVDITAVSSTLLSGEAPSANTPGVLVECIAPASAGTFTIPTYVLESLPSTVNSTALVPPGELLVGPASVACSSTIATSTTCPADLTLPSGLDALYIFYHFIQGQNVNWQ
jgi:uncharacterized protein (TIGR03437 family)